MFFGHSFAILTLIGRTAARGETRRSCNINIQLKNSLEIKKSNFLRSQETVIREIYFLIK